MATIAEIIAAREAKKNGTPAPAPAGGGKPSPAAKPKGSIAEMLELREAIDRIDPPGKHATRAIARGLVLSKHTPEAKEEQAPPTAEPAPRSLGAMSGEELPMCPQGADPETLRWHHAIQAFDTELCAMRDPSDPECVWLALRHYDKPELPPLLLHRLPVLLWDHPQRVLPEGHPF